MDHNKFKSILEKVKGFNGGINWTEGYGKLSRNVEDKYIQEWIRRLSSCRVNKYRYTGRIDNQKSFEGLELFLKTRGKVESGTKEYGRINLYSRDEFMRELKVFVEETRFSELSWDSRFINPVSFVAHGWSVEGISECVLSLVCVNCRSRWSVELNDSEFNEEYGKKLGEKHEMSCIWFRISVCLGMVYEINKGSIVYEIERINRGLRQFRDMEFCLEFDVPELVIKLGKSFKADDCMGLFYVLVRGYSVENAEVLEDAGSFTRVLTKDVLTQKAFNGHPNWSKYYEQDRFLRILYDAMICEELSDKNVQEKLSYFREVLTEF